MRRWQRLLIQLGSGVAVALIIASSMFVVAAHALTSPFTQAEVRVNQVGYVTDEPKQAILMANVAENGATFDLTLRIG